MLSTITLIRGYNSPVKNGNPALVHSTRWRGFIDIIRFNKRRPTEIAPDMRECEVVLKSYRGQRRHGSIQISLTFHAFTNSAVLDQLLYYLSSANKPILCSKLSKSVFNSIMSDCLMAFSDNESCYEVAFR